MTSVGTVRLSSVMALSTILVLLVIGAPLVVLFLLAWAVRER